MLSNLRDTLDRLRHAAPEWSFKAVATKGYSQPGRGYICTERRYVATHKTTGQLLGASDPDYLLTKIAREAA